MNIEQYTLLRYIIKKIYINLKFSICEDYLSYISTTEDYIICES